MKQNRPAPPRGKKGTSSQAHRVQKRTSSDKAASYMHTSSQTKRIRPGNSPTQKNGIRAKKATPPQSRTRTDTRHTATRPRCTGPAPRVRVTIARKSRGRGIVQVALLMAAVCGGVLFFSIGGGRDETVRYLEDIQTSFLQIEADFSTDQTGITTQDVPLLMDRAEQNAQQLAQDGTITDYEIGENCVYMQTPDGGGVVYAPTVADEDVPAPSPDAHPIQSTLPSPIQTPAQSLLPDHTPSPAQSVLPTQATTPVQSLIPSQTASAMQTFLPAQARVLCLQPSYDMFLWAFTTQQLEQIDTAAATFGSLPGYRFDASQDDLDNAAVDLAAAKAIAGCGIVIWEGHGGYTDTTHSFLFTGQKYTDDFYQKNRDDFQNGNLIATTDGYVAVTAGFFETYLPQDSLDGALIYLATCSSCRDDTLVRTLLNKGARAVYANDGVIYTIYNYAMLTRISALLCGALGEPLSTGEALRAAQAEYGYIDNCLLTPNPGAQTNSTTVRLFGDSNMYFDPAA